MAGDKMKILLRSCIYTGTPDTGKTVHKAHNSMRPPMTKKLFETSPFDSQFREREGWA